ncbi:MAG: phage major capsid protein, partial [Planctomycetes bacterium]|nr:phage major capsid protein [Planctomycetota bacterium]
DWEHGEDPDVGDEGFGVIDWASKKVDDMGVWVERILDRRSAYVQAIAPIINAQMMGTSSQADPEGIQKTKSGEIKNWPLVSDTLTVMPAEWRMMQDNAIRGALKSLRMVKDEKQEANAPEGSGKDPAPATLPPEPSDKKTIIQQENITMDPKEKLLREFAGAVGLDYDNLTDDQKAIGLKGSEFEEKAPEDRLSDLETGQKAISDQIAEILAALQDNSPGKSVGYISEVGGKDKDAQKTFGDFLVSVARGDMVRLNTIYGSYKSVGDTKAMNEGAGVGGGYTVPPAFRDTLLMMAAKSNDLRSKVTVASGMAPRGEWPSLDQFITVTAGQGDSPYAGGIVARRVAENAAFAETEAAFKQIKWNLEKVGGVTEVSNELISNSSESIDQLLSMLFALAIAQRREYYILRGNGAGEPLGILNAPCLVNVTPITNSVWTYDDALVMIAHFAEFLSEGQWLMHPSMIPDMGSFENGTGGSVLIVDQKNDNVIGTPLLGKVTGTSGHLPQANSSGCVILGDFSAYMLFEGKELEVAFSEHAKFEEDKGVWRFKQHLDGQPWLSGAITLPDPQGSYTVSPFVNFND